jgi:hypothetical protein
VKDVFVTSQYVDDPSFGSTSLRLLNKERVSFETPTSDYNAHTIADFSIQFFNPDIVNQRISISVNGQLVAVHLTPGVNTYTLDDFKLVWGDNFRKTPIDYVAVDLYSTGATDSGILIDNFSWLTKAESEKSLLLNVEEDNFHQITGIEELNDTNVNGHEDQTDTLQLTGKDQLLDLTALSSKIESIEIFDITGNGDNTLKLDLNALLQHGEKDLFIEDGKTQLVINGNEGDVVQLVDILPEGSDISEWQHQEGTVTVAGVEYNVYSHGDDAELLVQQGVKTELV